MTIRGLSGLGDALLLYPIIKYFLKTNPVTVFTNYPFVFEAIHTQPDMEALTFNPFHRTAPVDIDCSYLPRKEIYETTNYQDMCLAAGIEDQPFVYEYPKIEVVKPEKYVLFVDPYYPLSSGGCKNPAVIDAIPDFSMFQKAIDYYKDHGFSIVLVGKSNVSLNIKLKGIDLNLVDKTEFFELCELVKSAAVVITQQGLFIHLAEMLGTPLIALFAKKALASKIIFLRSFYPCKFINRSNYLSGKSFGYMDDVTEFKFDIY
jgi:ADP-heptose:LPS heptosyltransferase